MCNSHNRYCKVLQCIYNHGVSVPEAVIAIAASVIIVVAASVVEAKCETSGQAGHYQGRGDGSDVEVDCHKTIVTSSFDVSISG